MSDHYTCLFLSLFLMDDRPTSLNILDISVSAYHLYPTKRNGSFLQPLDSFYICIKPRVDESLYPFINPTFRNSSHSRTTLFKHALSISTSQRTSESKLKDSNTSTQTKFVTPRRALEQLLHYINTINTGRHIAIFSLNPVLHISSLQFYMKKYLDSTLESSIPNLIPEYLCLLTTIKVLLALNDRCVPKLTPHLKYLKHIHMNSKRASSISQKFFQEFPPQIWWRYFKVNTRRLFLKKSESTHLVAEKSDTHRKTSPVSTLKPHSKADSPLSASVFPQPQTLSALDQISQPLTTKTSSVSLTSLFSISSDASQSSDDSSVGSDTSSFALSPLIPKS